ncbi:MAG: response regulator transcription factor [Dehalococcoidia bacterium]
MACPLCGIPHEQATLCPRLQQVVASLHLFTVPAFLTDPLNRIVCVNQTFAGAIGDPVQDDLSWDSRFIVAAILGPYRDRFPRRKQEVSQCVSGLAQEVKAGRLSSGTVRLLDQTLAQYEDLARQARRTETPWDGTVVVKDPDGKLSLVCEQVVPVADLKGRDSGFHVSLWLRADRDPQESMAAALHGPAEVATMLTPRQLEVARLYASGLNSRGVAEQGQISLSTARSHLEEIYSRLGIHSRAELSALLVREGLA